MKNYKDFIFESEHTEKEEREIILDPIIPFFINKYDLLIDWAESKSHSPGIMLKRIIFEKKNEGDTAWNVHLIVPGWSSNDTNRLIQYILMKHYREFASIQGIEINDVSYAAIYNVNNSFDSLTYDVKLRMETRN